MKEPTKNYLVEAFQALKDLDLNEDVFSVDDNGITQANNFMDYEDEVENIIDPLAETEEELQDSYIGKAILDCVICQSKIYKDPSEVVIDDEANLANIGDICPFCQSTDGYKVIGQVAEYAPEKEAEVDIEPKDEVPAEEKSEEEDTDVEESVKSKSGLRKLNSIKEDKDMCSNGRCSREEVKNKLKARASKKPVTEDLENVQIETESERITVSSEPKEETSGEEMIAPLSTEVEADFKKSEPEDEYQDVDIDEFDEEQFDELGEKYLRRVYENVKSYKTTSGSTQGNKLKLEGVITFKSGKQAKTNFIFEAKTVTKSGKLKFLGENKQFARGNRAFTLTGTANKGKLVVESLNYNYRAKDTKTGASKRLYGTVTKNK